MFVGEVARFFAPFISCFGEWSRAPYLRCGHFFSRLEEGRASCSCTEGGIIVRGLMLLLLVEGAWNLPKVANATAGRCDSITDAR